MKQRKYKVIITKIGLVFYSMLVIVLFWGLAQTDFNPHTILGKLTQSHLGRLTFGGLLCIPFYILEKILNKIGYQTSRREEIKT